MTAEKNPAPLAAETGHVTLHGIVEAVTKSPSEIQSFDRALCAVAAAVLRRRAHAQHARARSLTVTADGFPGVPITTGEGAIAQRIGDALAALADEIAGGVQ